MEEERRLEYRRDRVEVANKKWDIRQVQNTKLGKKHILSMGQVAIKEKIRSENVTEQGSCHRKRCSEKETTS